MKIVQKYLKKHGNGHEKKYSKTYHFKYFNLLSCPSVNTNICNFKQIIKYMCIYDQRPFESTTAQSMVLNC